jgi:glycine reductase
MATTHVRDVDFAGRSRVERGVVQVDRDELRTLLLAEGAFEDVELDIVRPGEAARVIHIMDAVEPRDKPRPGSSFPAFAGPPKTVGGGRTHRLAGMAILSAGEPVAGEPVYWREAIVDMAGAGAPVTNYGSTVNLVLTFKPKPEYLNRDHPDAVIRNMMIGSSFAQRYNHAVRVAELKAAAYLARLAADAPADELEVYELGRADPSLPKVVYFYQLSGLVVYGENADSMLPTLMHPNEVLDGAIVNILSNLHAYCRYSTFDNQNHGIVKELYAQHGKTLDFAGVVLYPAASDDINKKEVVAEYAVKLAVMLGASGACNSYLGGGHPAVEFMLVCQKAERAGIKTVQVMPESYGTPDDPGFVYFVPEAARIVSTGRCTQTIELPSVQRLIGGRELLDLPDAPGGPLTITYRYLYGSGTSTGGGRLRGLEY